ncbi:MAG: DUF2513 domain-containing protein [Lentisphaeraceae bacterium]|nr:DUF2513 domain-containing protein [Lentisphaeraceae bacterium]
MKRDMDLIRELLLALEEERTPNYQKYSKEQVGHHYHLMGQAGLIVAVDITSQDHKKYKCALPSKLSPITWEGYEFLDASRSSQVWDAAKKEFAKFGGSLPFTVMKTFCVAKVKELIGLPE